MPTPSNPRSLARQFPKLANEDYQIIAPETGQYNCIAYAAGDTSAPWSDEPQDYWPPQVPRDPTLNGLRKLFQWLGYQKCKGPRLEHKYQKVALYAQQGLWTHAALQTPNGRWRSKLGQGPLIEHLDPRSLEGNQYGRPQIYMRKLREN